MEIASPDATEKENPGQESLGESVVAKLSAVSSGVKSTHSAPPDGGLWAWAASELLQCSYTNKTEAKSLTFDSCWRTSDSDEHMVRVSQ